MWRVRSIPVPPSSVEHHNTIVNYTDILGRVTTTAYSADGLITTVTTPAGV